LMETETGDAAVARRVLDGDADAFRELVVRYGEALYRFCAVRLGDADDAEDAVQDVFIRVFKSLRSYDPSRSFRSWLFAIAANRVKTRYGARVAQAGLVEKVAMEHVVAESARLEESDAEREALMAMAVKEIRAALARLSPAYRAPVELYYFGGLGVSEVASALGIGSEAVKSRLFRARKELAAILEAAAQPKRRGKGM
ncbi:MAG: RNA polymerase sigma factor, partial [Spirochaetales bacterium]